MKSRISILAAFALAALTLASSASANKVEQVHDPEFDFSKGTTYRWGEKKIPDDPEVSWEWIDSTVKSIVDDEMRRKKMAKVGVDPAYEIYYYLGADEVNQISSHYGAQYYSITWSYWGWVRGPGAYAQDARIYDQGSVTLDIVDTVSGALVWRATESGALKPNSLPKERAKNLEKIVARLLKAFPPK